MITNTSLSLFNKYTDENKNVVFKKHMIKNVFWDDSKGININRGHENADNVIVFIPKNKNDFKKYVQPKKYLGTNGTWTLQNGDFIVKGEVAENEVKMFQELSAKYDNVFTITMVDNKDFGNETMHHFEIRGK